MGKDDEPARADITRILDAIREGNERAGNRLMTAVYTELRRIAGAKMTGERPGRWTVVGMVLVLASLWTVVHAPAAATGTANP